jgi:hypothetical protein
MAKLCWRSRGVKRAGATEVIREAAQIDGSGDGHGLQMCFGKSNMTRPAQPKAAKGLGYSAFDSHAQFVLLPKFVGLLFQPSTLQRFMLRPSRSLRGQSERTQQVLHVRASKAIVTT